jgi:hypothetical protein
LLLLVVIGFFGFADSAFFGFIFPPEFFYLCLAAAICLCVGYWLVMILGD